MLTLSQISCLHTREKIKHERKNLILAFFNEVLSRDLFDDIYLHHYILQDFNGHAYSGKWETIRPNELAYMLSRDNEELLRHQLRLGYTPEEQREYSSSEACITECLYSDPVKTGGELRAEYIHNSLRLKLLDIRYGHTIPSSPSGDDPVSAADGAVCDEWGE